MRSTRMLRQCCSGNVNMSLAEWPLQATAFVDHSVAAASSTSSTLHHRTSPNSRSMFTNTSSFIMRRLARLRWNMMRRGTGACTGGGSSAGASSVSLQRGAYNPCKVIWACNAASRQRFATAG